MSGPGSLVELTRADNALRSLGLKLFVVNTDEPNEQGRLAVALYHSLAVFGSSQARLLAEVWEVRTQRCG